MLFNKMHFIPSNTNALLILLGNSFGYLFIQKVIASRNRSCGIFEYRFSTSNVTSILFSYISFSSFFQKILCILNITFLRFWYMVGVKCLKDY